MTKNNHCGGHWDFRFCGGGHFSDRFFGFGDECGLRFLFYFALGFRFLAKVKSGFQIRYSMQFGVLRFLFGKYAPQRPQTRARLL